MASDYLAVVALDFGTTFCGFAFAFNNVYKKGERGIHSKTWGENQGMSTSQVPTHVLLNPNKTFHSFGYDAQENFACLKNAKDYYYFERFKMNLHHENKKVINSSMMLEDYTGKKLPALDVFAHAIKFLKNEALETINTMGCDFKTEDVQWVLTVPAIWRPSSRRFMREAAKKAGIASDKTDQLIIALEPEAASLHCRQRKMREFRGEKGEVTCADAISKPKTKYMVVDSGGGTVDFTVHSVNPNDTLKEIHKASGGAWGAIAFEEEFEKQLVKVVGKDAVNTFQLCYPQDWVDLITSLEKTKRSTRHLEGKPTRVRVTAQFSNYFMPLFEKAKLTSDDIELTSDHFSISAGLMKSFLKPSIDKIVSHIRRLLRQSNVKDIKYIFLVGGFSDSPLLQQAVKDAFSKKYRILIPLEASLAVVKGAVMFGQQPEIIEKRVCGQTYGISVLRDFDENIHDKRYKTINADGKIKCDNLFHRLIKINDVVKIGEIRKFVFHPSESRQTAINFTMYVTEEDDAKYTDEPHVQKEGTVITIDSPDTSKGCKRDLELRIEFGGTEMKVSVIDVESGNNQTSHVNLLTVDD